MPKTMTKGSGITERAETVWGGDLGPADLWKFAVEMVKPGSAKHFQFDGVTARVGAWARAILEQARRDHRAVAWDDDSPESYACRIDHYIGIVRDCIKRRDANNAARFALEVGRLAEQARMKFAWEKQALHGAKMEKGRKRGTAGPIRKAIADAVRKAPGIKARDLWERFAARSPRTGWTFYPAHAMGPNGKQMDFRRFANLVSEERKVLKAPKITD